MKAPRSLTKREAQKEFLILLEGVICDFPTHPESANICVPREFTPLLPLAKFVRRKVDPFVYSITYSLFAFHWSFGPMSNGVVQINAIPLPSGARVFWFLDSWREWEEQHFVAGTASAQVTDVDFLRLLFKSNAKEFGHEMFGAPPHEIVTSMKGLPELPDLFLSAYLTSPGAWDALLDNPPDGDELDPKDPNWRRELVARHLREVIL